MITTRRVQRINHFYCFSNAYLDHKIDIWGYAIQSEVRLLRGFKNRNPFLLTFAKIFYKWRWIDMRPMEGQMFQALTMLLNL